MRRAVCWKIRRRCVILELTLFSLMASGSGALGQESRSVTDSCTEIGGAVAWWTFDGEPAVSIGTSMISGALTGSPLVVPGKVGNGLDFLMADDGIAFGSMDWVPDGEFTFETWLRTESSKGMAELIRWSSEKGMFVAALREGRPWVRLYDASIQTGDADLSDGRWHHLALVVLRGSATAIQAFVDGDPLTISPGSGFDENPEERLGLLIGGAKERAFIGSLDELTVHGRALRRTEVVGVWAAGNSGKCPVEESGNEMPATP